MKHLILSLLFGFLAIGCNRSDDPPANPIAQLPPATTTGANKAGCLINGEIFLPHQNNPTGPSPLTCYYQYVDGGWEFGLSMINDQNNVRGIHIATNKMQLQQGSSYVISNELSSSSVFAFYTLPNNQYGYITTTNQIGQLTITKLDTINHIISGTFYFDAVKLDNGEIVKITEGRFDVHYTP